VSETFVIVGASLAGASAAATLREEGFRGRIILLGEEAELPYERPPLSKDYLRGESQREKFLVHPAPRYDELQIDLRLGQRAIALDPAARDVTVEGGERLRYDRLLLATGSSPRRLALPGHDLEGIHYLRTVADSEAIAARAKRASRAVVIGGGWIGAEVAASLRQLGLTVTLVVPTSVPLERVLGVEVGGVYGDLHAENGVQVAPGKRAVAFRGSTTVESVEIDDGTEIAADLVVVGVGAEPRIELARAAGLDVGTGVNVDEYLEASVPGIFAAGDIAEAWHPDFGARVRIEHWDNAKRQGRAAARNMLGRAEPYRRVPYFYSDQFDLGMEYAGYAPAWDEVVFRGDPAKREFVAFWLRNGRVVAGMNANIWDVNDEIIRLIEAGQPVDRERLTDATVPLTSVAAQPSSR
jgi:3-phenylpropionate/trans-cinnamate dioxygenase ferredoxin reductase component